MALEPPPDPSEPDVLRRAVGLAREEEPEDWGELSVSIKDRVRRLVSPADPLLTFTDLGTTARDVAGSTTQVSSRVVVLVLRRLLQRPTHAPHDIDLVVEDGRLAEVHLALVAAYGVDLHALGAEVRGEVSAALGELLGPDPAFLAVRDVVVSVVDVTPGDPNRV